MDVGKNMAECFLYVCLVLADKGVIFAENYPDMANNYLNRYAWLIDVVRRHGYITLTDISDLWEKSALNDTGGPLPERTFHNHRKSIEEIFGIQIRFNKTRGYYLDMSDESSEEMTDWLLTSLSVSSAIRESTDLRNRIIFADVPSGKRFLTDFINAMKESKKIKAIYHKFGVKDPEEHTLSPYFLKVFKQRWYIIAKDDNDGYVKPFALDRVIEVVQTQKAFKLPKDFCAEEYFRGYFGVVRDNNLQPQTVKLKVWGKQRDYFKTLPLNETMREVEIYGDYSIFTCRIAPTWDLEMELLQYNDWVEVLEPQCLRENMIEHAQNILNLYNA